MKVVLQRVSKASVTSKGETLASQGCGFLLLLGITSGDDKTDIAWLTRKISGLRVFPDEDGKMNHSIRDLGGEVTVVSQFTLLASTKKGNRPSFLGAAKPDISEGLYEQFCETMENELNLPVGRGRFGAEMQVSLINDGPVTILFDSKNPA
jgi:D-tyrosyl-tRNA(Tyr) deacylase